MADMHLIVAAPLRAAMRTLVKACGSSDAEAAAVADNRWGQVPEPAPVAVFPASDAASFINGHVLYVDGGISATL